MVVLEENAVVGPHLADVPRQLKRRLVLTRQELVLDARQVLEVRVWVAHQLHEPRVLDVRLRHEDRVVLVHLQELKELFNLLLGLLDFLYGCLEHLHLLLVDQLRLRLLVRETRVIA